MGSAAQVLREINRFKNSKRAKLLQRFFKTAPGEYAAGDIFLGLTVPECRIVAKRYTNIDSKEARALLRRKEHEARLVALLILVSKFRAANNMERNEIVKLYLQEKKYVNNWDLVDLSASHILGTSLLGESSVVLDKLARSKVLWDRRIATISTLAFIAQNDFAPTLRIAKLLLEDKHDLIHKAVGWMLREVGKRSLATEEKFLKQYYKIMPRTMLRYAIERFPEPKRQRYLKGLV